MAPADTKRKKRKKKKVTKSPEEDPLWGLLGVWGRVFIVFSNIGFLLYVGSLLVGWGMLKFLVHVSGTGFLLLFARPNYSPFLSGYYCSPNMTHEEIAELRAMVVRKLNGESPEYPLEFVPSSFIPQGYEGQSRLSGSLGIVGRLLTSIISSGN